MQDMGELEAGVGQALYPLHSLGLPFSMLRALRRLLFMDTADIVASPLLRDLPASVVLHHLYSQAPASLPSPHVKHGFTAAQVQYVCSEVAVSDCTVRLLHWRLSDHSRVRG